MKNELEVLLSDEFRRAVEANLGRDPMRIALDKGVANAALVASQVKYLGRAAEKLPSWHAARCVVPPLAFEQSSSEAAALRKWSADDDGGLAIDLTCGLGVDAYALSRRFERVVAVERDPALAAVVRENFRRLGVDNVEVVGGFSAEEFLEGEHAAAGANLIYIDPDRRGASGEKLVRLEDCSPDVVGLLPRLSALAPRLVVKLSPLFDVDEVFRVFGPRCVCVDVVSLGDECKEVVADVRFCAPDAPPTPSQKIRAIAIGLGEVEYPASCSEGEVANTFTPKELSLKEFSPAAYTHLVIPDVALQKARLARRYFSERGVWIESENGYGFAASKPENTLGRAMPIASLEPFDPKALKRTLKARGVKNIDIFRRDFPLSTADIARQLGVREGGSTRIAFTRASGRLWQIVLGPSSSSHPTIAPPYK
jgi:hypothetical protein